MPRPLSGDEDGFSDGGSDVGDITHGTPPADQKPKKQLNGELHDDVEKGSSSAQSDDGSDGGDGDEEGEDEYVVEAIQSHRTKKGVIEYNIKWVGYDEAENTWEPEENLMPHARNILQEYHNSIGGVPSAKAVKRTKSRQSLKSQASQEQQPQRKRQKRSAEEPYAEQEWTPSGKDWEPQVDKIETVERNEAGTLMAYIMFKNGKKSKVTMDKVYQHCPRPMLRFYEDHLKFN